MTPDNADPLDGPESQGLTIGAPQAMQRREPTPMDLIAQAIALGPEGVAVVRELRAMQIEMENRNAEMAFQSAFKDLQSELPVIPKNGKNAQGQSYATYEDAVAHIRPIMTKHGFSTTVSEESISEHGIQFVLWLKHSLGHKEPTRRTFPNDKAAMNSSGKPIRPAIQDAGSTTKYAERYLLFQALGLVAEGEDTDGNSAKRVDDDEIKTLKSLCEKSGTSESAFLSMMVTGVAALDAIPKRDFHRLKTALETKIRAKKS